MSPGLTRQGPEVKEGVDSHARRAG
jgi:hypothetical protein